jgi:hypothetical protein
MLVVNFFYNIALDVAEQLRVLLWHHMGLRFPTSLLPNMRWITTLK